MNNVHAALLRALEPGDRVWTRVSGRSMWPLLLDGDRVQVEGCTAQELSLGSIAVVDLPSGLLAAHVVASVHPLRTTSITGVPDDDGQLIGRVVAVQRWGRRFPVSRLTAMTATMFRKVAPILRKNRRLQRMVWSLRK